MLCSKLHCQKGFDLIFFPYTIARLVQRSLGAWHGESRVRAVHMRLLVRHLTRNARALQVETEMMSC